MARLRKFVCYRRIERPYTKWSRRRELCFVKGRPQVRISKFETGEPGKAFPISLSLCVKKDCQIRDNALESARLAANRWLEKKIGKTGWHLQLRAWPHHVLRENVIASGAGADRSSTGMAHPFGKPIGNAAICYAGKPLLTVRTANENVETARQALARAATKLPVPCRIS